MIPYGKSGLRGTFDGTTLPTVTYTARGGSPATWAVLAVEIEIEDAGDEEAMRDGNGTIDGFYDKDPHDLINAKFYVKASSQANAQAAAKLPKKFTEVVLANFIAASFAFLNGTYGYTKGGKFKLTAGEDADAEFTIPLKKFYKPDGTAVDTNVTTGIFKPITS
jgi:hypothetical protein